MREGSKPGLRDRGGEQAHVPWHHITAADIKKIGVGKVLHGHHCLLSSPSNIDNTALHEQQWSSLGRRKGSVDDDGSLYALGQVSDNPGSVAILLLKEAGDGIVTVIVCSSLGNIHLSMLFRFFWG